MTPTGFPRRCDRGFTAGALACALIALANIAVGAETPAVLESKVFRLELSPDTGVYQILDKASGHVWGSNPFVPRFGEVSIWRSGKLEKRSLGACAVSRSAEVLKLTFHPVLEEPSAALEVAIRSVDEGRAMEVAFLGASGLSVESIGLLDQAFWTTDARQGYGIVPVREGMILPATSKLSFSQRFDTYAYEGCHMAMLGVVSRGSAVLMSWQDPYVMAEFKSVLTNAGPETCAQVLAPSLQLRNTAKTIQVRLLGRGDYVDVAKAYLPLARQRGWYVPWNEKLKANPQREKLFGAANYKLWSMLSRQMNENSSKEESVRVNWTFSEAAQVAEHLKRDLRLDRVLFTIGGWIHRGYDNQHPDILPTAPECGGDAAFADCARRVMELGYVFCLHDNYQDIYRDSPSWDEQYIMKQHNGLLTKGGHWAGGVAYLTCSQKAVELARRPQNLPAVQRLSKANSYFIDTTYASGLQECFDPKHPLTRTDDMRWKQAISDYARDVFGIFGSECGREWAIPHSDFFEGLTGVGGTYYHNKDLVKNLGATVVPLFELVYRDCIVMQGKYGYDVSKAADYALHHLVLGRTLHYHSIPSHLYWKDFQTNRVSAAPSEGGAGDPALFLRAEGGWADGMHPVDRFVKNTHELLGPLNELTSTIPMTRHQFLSPDHKVQRSDFGNGISVIVNRGQSSYSHQSAAWGRVVLPPFGFLVEGPELVAFHASRWNNQEFSRAPLFTLRSLDRQPIGKSKRVRVFHGFGDAGIRLGGAVHQVAKEAVLDLSHAN